MMQDDLISALHASPSRGVFAITGGGSGAIERLLTTPGASATVLEAIVPYSAASLVDWLGSEPVGSCSEATARAIAVRAYQRAEQLDRQEDRRALLGVGCTASLASNRPKRGAHRAHIAIHSLSQTLVVSLHFEKGRRTRAEEEQATAHAVIAATADVAGIHELDLSKTPPGIEAHVRRVAAQPEWMELLAGKIGLARCHNAQPAGEPLCLLPGSFNPPHDGHVEIARIAAEKTGRPVVLELSIMNVDKPPLDFVEIENRLAGLEGEPVWLTRAPTFLEKAELAPGAIFAVGADTIQRIGQPRYYDSIADRDVAFARLDQLGCRFLVFGRQTADRFETLSDLKLPPALRSLCDEVSADEFRVDLSSTTLRKQ